MKIRFTGYPHLQTYTGTDVPGGEWVAGTERTIPDAVGGRLLKQHPTAFVEVAGKAPMRPRTDRAVPSGVFVPVSVLAGSVKALRASLATGDHDAHLLELKRAEVGGKARARAITAIEERIAEVSG